MAAPPTRFSFPSSMSDALPEEVQPFAQSVARGLNPFLNDVQNALDKQLTIGSNLVSVVKEVQVVAPDPGWIYVANAELLAGATNYLNGYQPFRYRMEPGGIVRAEFVLATSVTDTTVFFLPDGYHPGGNMEYAVSGGSNVLVTLTITVEGAVYKGGVASNFLVANIAFPVSPDPAYNTAPAPVAAFSGPGWPIVLESGFGGTRVIDCRRLSVFDTQNGVPLTTCTYEPDWILDNKGRVVIRSLWGLVPGRTYKIRFLLLGE